MNRRRLLLAGGVLATLATVAALVSWTQRSRPPSAAAALADSLAGERWYLATLGHKPIGHYRAWRGRGAGGHFEFRSELRFALRPGGETRMADRLVFDRQPPHGLIAAEHAAEGAGEPLRVVVREGGAEIFEAGEQRRGAVDGWLALGDYLAVERELSAGAARVGDLAHARTLDFEQLAVVANRWRILVRDDDGAELALEDREPGVVVRLDSALAPVWMRMGELFVLRRVADEEAAQAWRTQPPPFARDAPRVPLDQPIARPEALERLVLATERGGDVWPPVATVDANAHAPAPAEDRERALAATLAYPVDDPRLRALAERAVAGAAAPQEQADALTLFVHRYLDYHDASRPRSVLETFRERRGDCTEFADLYATLARAVGLPARTVVGLAYRAEEPPGFALHAWNEVAIDGRWRPADPTWGLTRLPATHLPLPAGAAAAAIAQLPKLRLRVAQARYRED